MKGRCGKGRILCLIACGVVIAIVLLIVILALTVFKPRKLATKVDSIHLGRMDMDMNIFALKVDLNVSLDLDVSMKNTNNFGFKYSNTTAQLNYRGKLIGEAPIPSEEISPQETKGLNLTLNIMADRVMSNTVVFKDLVSGALPLNFFLSIEGKVNFLGFIKVHVSSTASCDLNLILYNRTVADTKCVYTTKL